MMYLYEKNYDSMSKLRSYFMVTFSVFLTVRRGEASN